MGHRQQDYVVYSALTASVASRDDVVQQDVLECGLPQQGIQGQLAVGSTQVGQQCIKGFISGGKDLKEGEGTATRQGP